MSMPDVPTKLLMAGSAVFLALCGAALLFLPESVSGLFSPEAGSSPEVGGVFFAQQFGTALLGLAAVNWVARASALGGIYGRAVVVGNVVFFTANALLLAGRVLDGPGSWALWMNLLIVAALAFGFARLLLGGGPKPNVP